MAKRKSTNTKKNCAAVGPAFNIGKPVVFMVAAILTCLCLSLGGFMVGYNVGVRNATTDETTETETTDTTTETNDTVNQ